MVLYSVRLGKPGFVTAQTELTMMEGANFGFIGRRETHATKSLRQRKEGNLTKTPTQKTVSYAHCLPVARNDLYVIEML